MRVLRRDSTGPDVERWQYFLIGQGYDVGRADTVFGPRVESATTAFQGKYFGPADRKDPAGVVGNFTLGRAMTLGFHETVDDDESEHSSNWPPAPSFQPLIGNDTRQALFGHFKFKPSPTPGNPENITILDDWVTKNIIPVNIPQIIGMPGFPKSGNMEFHRLGAKQLAKLFSDWHKAGLLYLLKEWGGSYVARFVRGSTTTLSNHSQGSAFDVNMTWNPLGAMPALAGELGSVRELVAIANDNGFYWGGHFKNRPDGMHFEIAQLK